MEEDYFISWEVTLLCITFLAIPFNVVVFQTKSQCHVFTLPSNIV